MAEKQRPERNGMDRLTESEKTFLESFLIVAKRPYLGYLAAAILFSVGMALYSRGIGRDQSAMILIAGMFFGWSLFEIIESYLAYRLYTILRKMKNQHMEWSRGIDP